MLVKGGGAKGRQPKADNQKQSKDSKLKTANFTFMSLQKKRESINPGDWLEDSGTSEHYTHQKGVLNNYVRFDKPHHLILGDGRELKVLGIGDVLFDSRLGERNVSVTLKDVHYAPDLIVNLVSTLALDIKGLSSRSGNRRKTYTFKGQEVLKIQGGMATCGVCNLLQKDTTSQPQMQRNINGQRRILRQ